MRLSLAEIVNKAIEIKKREEKIKWLQENDSLPLRTIFKVMYDKNIKVLLPSSEPPYKESSITGIEGMLFKEARRLKIFVEGGGYDNLNQIKREQLFIGLLEDVDKDDAKLLLKMIRQKPLTGLPMGVIQESFPNLISKSQKEK